jgi:16S rRNA (adenine1518-N6/adenine1519-N6)-dimethyltransferase
VYAVEIDENLLPVLADTLSAYDNVTVVNQDILKCDIGKLIGEGNSCKIVANLPYYITTPIIMGLLEGGVPAESITVMVQKEVAERMAAGPGSKIYGALSLAVQFYAETYLAANVPPNCFMPRPAVGSAVIRLTKRSEPAVTVKDERFMFRLIRASFNERRKTLVNSLRNEPSLGLSREQVEDALGKMGLSPTVRGETLSLEQFAELSDLLHV